MRKRIYIGIITFITLCCVIIGFLRNVSYSIHWGDDSKDIPLQGMELDNYRKISIQGDVMEVEFIQGEKYKLSYECTEGLEPVYSIKNDTMTVTQKKKKEWKFFGIVNRYCKVIIELPKDTVLEKMDIKLDVGNVTIGYIKTELTNISIDVGEINIENSMLGDTVLDIDTGNINITESEFANMEAKADVGEIEISSHKDLTDYSFEVKSDIGEVSINNQNYGRKYENAMKSNYKLKATTDVGAIDIHY